MSTLAVMRARIKELEKALRSMVNTIEGMACTQPDCDLARDGDTDPDAWFGEFRNNHTFYDDGTVAIEWPDLRLVAEDAKKLVVR